MSFLWPRVISIHRSRTVAAETPSIGETGYSGREDNTSPSDPEGERVLFTGVCAQIVAKRAGQLRTALVTDVTANPQWMITTPASALPQYSVRDRDIVIDDEGYRYQVSQNYWTPLGYELACVRLEA
jgi:hypothetical protein